MAKTVVNIQKQADSMRNIGTAMTLGVTTPLLGAGIAALKMAGDMEQTQIAFTNMLGGAQKAQEFLKQLAKFAEKTPFEFKDLTKQARQLMAFGFAAEDIIPMLTAVGDTISAMGGNAEMIDRVTLALAKMQAKQKVSAKEMLQLTEAGIPAWGYLAQSIGKSVPETMKLAEKGLIPANIAINSILSAMERDFGGMMAKQSRTLLGSWSNLLDVLSRVTTNFGEMINNTLGITQKIQTLTTWLENFADSLEKLNPALKATVVWLGIGVISIGPLLLGLSMLVRISAFAGIGIALLSSMTAKAAFAFASWRGGAASLMEALTYFVGSKARLVILSITGIIAATILIINYWDKLRAFAVSVWNIIGGIALYGASLVVRGVGLIIYGVSAIIPAFRGAANAVLGLANSLKSAAAQSFASAKSALTMASAGQQIAQNQQGISKVGQQAANSQEQLAKATEDAAKAAENNIQSFDEVHQIQDQIAQSPASTIEAPTVDIPATTVIGSIGDIGADIATGIGQQISSIADKASAAWARLQQAIEPVNRAIQWIKDNWTTIGPIIEGIASIIMVLLVPALIKAGIEATINGAKMVAAWVMQGAAALVHGATIVGQILLTAAKWAWLGIQALANAGKVVLAWAMQGWQAVASVAIQLVQFALLGANWIWLGIQAGIGAAQVVAAWIMQQVQAVASVAVQIAQFVLLGAKWVWMGITAMANAAVMAAAWFVALGPVAWVIATITLVAAVVALNWETVKTKTIEIWEAVSTWLNDKWEWIKTIANSAWGVIKKYIIDPMATVQNWLSTTWNDISTKLSNIWNSIKDTAAKVWDSIEAAIKAPINGIIRAINWMIDGLNRIHFSIPEWVPGLGGKSFGFNLSKIPMLAEGGIVTRPTLAMIGEAGPEAVVPLSRAQSSDDIAQAVYQAIIDAFRIQNVTQSNSEKEIVLKIDSTTFARIILPAIIKEGQRQGMNLVVRPQEV
ncbi:tape measure protein [Caldanaerobacter sp.]|uniref:tape measure protein n=1 Tax=Caldanaerobacter sp. TaxID=2930036 RepID=UPI003C74851F